MSGEQLTAKELNKNNNIWVNLLDLILQVVNLNLLLSFKSKESRQKTQKYAEKSVVFLQHFRDNRKNSTKSTG